MEITERLLWEKTLGDVDAETRTRLLLDVLDEMPQMVLALDADGWCFFCNKQWHAYTGLSAEQSRERGFLEAIPGADRERVVAEWRRAAEVGVYCESECRFVHRDGEARWFMARAMPVRDPESGRIRMWVGAFTDIHERWESRERLQAALRREGIRSRIGEVLRATTGPEAVLAAACQEVAESLLCARVHYARIDAARDTAAVLHLHSRDGSPGAFPYRLSAMGRSLRDDLAAGRTVVIADTRTDSRTARAFQALYAPGAVRAFVAVPLRRGGEWIALFAAVEAEAPRDWTADEIALIEAVARQTEAVADLAGMLARERRTAQAFQTTVSPPPAERLGAYRFTSHYAAALSEAAVGGDFYDQFPLPEGRVGVAVGDVSGKGIDAAVQTALVKFTLRAFAGEDPAPARALARVNRALLAQKGLSGFATLCFALLDASAGTLTYASAGHETCLLRPSGSPEARELEATGPVLGLGGARGYEERALPFVPGDRLLLYTDGLTEARAASLLLGVEGVARLFCGGPEGEDLEETRRRLLDEAARFARRGFGDDLALLLVEALPFSAPALR